MEKTNSKFGTDETKQKRDDVRHASHRQKRGSKTKGFNKDFVKQGPNDIKWRTNTELAKAAGNLPFGFPAGLQYDRAGEQLDRSVVLTSRIPGIMSVRIMITLGKSADYNSAANLAFRKIYSYVRHANSGSKNYEANDMGMYFMSVGQAIACLGWLQRIYRTITTFSGTNRYTPRELITIQGVNYDDLRAHQAELAWLIRWLGNSINSLYCPKMPYFDACEYAFSKYFEDNTSPKHQIYMLSPEVFGVYDPVLTSAGGGVTFLEPLTKLPQPSGTLLNYSDIVLMVNKIMDVLLSDEDIGVISGDILKAYGESGLFKVTPQLDSNVDFEKSDEILQQFHNLTTLDSAFASLEYYEQTVGGTSTAPYIVHHVSMGLYPLSATSKWSLNYVDAFSAVPDYEEIFNCCVLKAHVRFLWNSGTATIRDISFGMYLPVATDICFNVGSSGGSAYTRMNIYGPQVSMVSTISNFTSYLRYVTNFDWHPLIPFVDLNQIYFIGDIQNLNFFEDDVFERIHTTSMLSLLDLTEK